MEAIRDTEETFKAMAVQKKNLEFKVMLQIYPMRHLVWTKFHEICDQVWNRQNIDFSTLNPSSNLINQTI